jgi:hypothetical protein
MHPKEACWLARHAPEQRICSGRLERFHFIPRQRVEAGMWEQLRGAMICCPICGGSGDWRDSGSCEGCFGAGRTRLPFSENLILLAAWDPRNGGISCVGHHRRFDNHATPSLSIPYAVLPRHVVEFVKDWGLEIEAERRFASP